MHKARLNAIEHSAFGGTIEKSSRFDTVRAKRAVCRTLSGSNPIMFYFRLYQRDVLDAGGRNIAF